MALEEKGISLIVRAIFRNERGGKGRLGTFMT